MGSDGVRIIHTPNVQTILVKSLNGKGISVFCFLQRCKNNQWCKNKQISKIDEWDADVWNDFDMYFPNGILFSIFSLS
jgi:hypothetical protein